MIIGRKYHKKKGFWFAWRPVQVDDGRWVWLHRVWYEKRIDGYIYYLCGERE